MLNLVDCCRCLLGCFLASRFSLFCYLFDCFAVLFVLVALCLLFVLLFLCCLVVYSCGPCC